MSDNDPEIIPPEKRGLPARRDDNPAPAVYRTPAPQPNGVLSSALTGLQAKMQARAFGEMATNIRAQTDVLNAETVRRESALKLLRTTHMLEEAPDILALDRAERQAERAAKYGELVAKHESVAENQEERAHQAELARRRRQRELDEAETANIEARRHQFNAEQGLENQQRLKELNLRTWERRKDIERLNVEVRASQVRDEFAGDADRVPGSGADQVRDHAQAALLGALADGDDAEITRWQKVLDVLDGLA
jgi:hypothetical protein